MLNGSAAQNNDKVLWLSLELLRPFGKIPSFCSHRADLHSIQLSQRLCSQEFPPLLTGQTGIPTCMETQGTLPSRRGQPLSRSPAISQGRLKTPGHPGCPQTPFHPHLESLLLPDQGPYLNSLDAALWAWSFFPPSAHPLLGFPMPKAT